MGKMVFNLHKGIEICGKDGDKAFDNLSVKNPVFDGNGDLIVMVPASTDPEHAELKLRLRVHKNNIAYDIDGDDASLAIIIDDIEAREDCLKI